MTPELQSAPKHTDLGTPIAGSMEFQKVRPIVMAVALLMAFLSASGLFLSLPGALSGHVDFRSFYSAGHMVRAGHAAGIYDYGQTKQFQDALVGPADVALPFNHLAYESLIDVPFSYLSYKAAYLTFLFFNLVLLAASIYILRSYLTAFSTVWSYFPVAFVLCFLPVTMTLIEGQDSLLLLALLSVSARAFDQQKELKAGLLLGVTLFKFQYALPIAALFFVWRRWRFLAGFVISGVVVVLISVWLLGYSGVLSYLHYLPGASSRFSADNDVRLGIHPDGMPNIRGFIYTVSGGAVSFTNILTVVLSCVVLGWAALHRASMHGAVLAALLVSYHQMISDTSLLLLPLELIACRILSENGTRRTWLLVLAVTAFVGPTILLFAGTRFYLLTLPVIGLFLLWNPQSPNHLVAAAGVHNRRPADEASSLDKV